MDFILLQIFDRFYSIFFWSSFLPAWPMYFLQDLLLPEAVAVQNSF